MSPERPEPAAGPSNASSPSARSLAILIVDDHDVVRIGFKQILSEHSRFKVAGEASSTAEALEQKAAPEQPVAAL